MIRSVRGGHWRDLLPGIGGGQVHAGSLADFKRIQWSVGDISSGTRGLPNAAACRVGEVSRLQSSGQGFGDRAASMKEDRPGYRSLVRSGIRNPAAQARTARQKSGGRVTDKIVLLAVRGGHVNEPSQW